MHLPTGRGPLSHAIVAALRDEADVPRRLGVRDEDDFQLALWILYELHYRGFDDVEDDQEWNPELLRVRAHLEAQLERRVRERTRGLVEQAAALGGTVVDRLRFIADSEGAGLPTFLHREADAQQWSEFLVTRSVYHLKESDPQAWVVPRVTGAVKAALVELQYDEYGGGAAERVHQELFADALRDAGLDATYGAYLDQAPAHVLAVNNVMSLFGLHRRLRGAALGHLAAFEMTSSLPCRRYAQGAARLGLKGAEAYYDEHVEADAVHEQLASRSICGALVEQEPELLDDVLLGAAACILLERDSGEQMMSQWAEGRSALRGGPLPGLRNDPELVGS
ncbi:MAG: iron-containing redox enzyme family protein [Marmoricola sp.]